MLVLTRKESQVILIGDDVVIRIVQSGKSTVRIGIEAPQSTRVIRGELELDADAEPAILRAIRPTGGVDRRKTPFATTTYRQVGD